MTLTRQVWTLMCKNWRILLLRHPVLVAVMAVLLPVLLAGFFSSAKNLLVPPATFGIGSRRDVMTLAQAFDAARGSGKDRLVLVNAGSAKASADLDRVLDELARQASGGAVRAVRVAGEEALAGECRSSLRGVTACFGAVVMRSSPRDGPGAVWNYTIHTDAALAQSPLRVRVDGGVNAEQVFLLPVQRAVDAAIARLGPGSEDPLARNAELAFTSETQAERDGHVRNMYLGAVVNFLGVAFVSTVVWVTYHVAGFVAAERESGMAQLIDAMTTTAATAGGPMARIMAHHLSFSAVYAPAWVAGALIIRYTVFVNTSAAAVIALHLLAGLALAAFAILSAAFFATAQLSGAVALLATVLLAILAQSVTAPGTAAVALLSGLFAPCAYVFAIGLVARFEMQARGASLTAMPPDSPWRVPGLVLGGILLVQIFAYLMLAVHVERWRFATPARGRHHVVRSRPQAHDGGDTVVELDRLTKVYPPGPLARLGARLSRSGRRAEPVVAVRDLSLRAGRGQIVALVGANGSGKSTTLDAIAGLHRPTSGAVTVAVAAGADGGLGIAPQRNVLWDDLAVEEHLAVFSRLKAPGRRPGDDVAALVRAIDLWPKRRALAKTLSGGQKRKLQLGMMLAGGSTVCCVDEVSSGLDPLSRRKVWDILLAERGRRTLLVTTHFLDEADMLADHVAVLSRGTLRAAGSAVELKARFGGGYRVHVPGPSGPLPDVAGVPRREAFGQVTYAAATSGLAARVVGALEAAAVTDYSFCGPTMEDVFLQLADEAEADADASKTAACATEKPRGDDSDSTPSPPPSPPPEPQQQMRLVDGTRVGLARQAAVLLRKRFTIVRRNWQPSLAAVALPVAAAGLTALYVRHQAPRGCSAAHQALTPPSPDVSGPDGDGLLFLAGPAARVSPAVVTRLLDPVLNGSGPAAGSAHLRLVDTYADFARLVVDKRRLLINGVWLGDGTSPPTSAWVANRFVTSALAAQQLLDVLLANTSIATAWAPFAVPLTPAIGDTLHLVVYMGVALACYPAFFALYPSGERRAGVRALQYSNGVAPLALWPAYLAFDFALALAASALVVGLWAALSSVWFHVEYLFVVLVLYGLASTLLAYFVSLFATSQLVAFAWAAAYQAVVFLAYLIAYMATMTFADIASIDSTVLVCHLVLSALAPVGSVARALFITTNLFSTACDGPELSQTPGGFLVYGGPVAYLVAQSAVLFGLLVCFDGNGSPARRLRLRARRPGGAETARGSEAAIDDNDADAASQDECLRVRHLTKAFGRTTAVDNVSFGVARGEVFALLGPNGAGKSTTMSLIRGDARPAGGDVLVEGRSVRRSRAAARAHLGVCPQADALDLMTVREHLVFYARVRGVPDVGHNVAAVLRAVGLEALGPRMAHALSGGNKRKLSLAIALMGNPAVVLLDEPSSGLDAAAKRVMWRTLAAAAPGRSILLTTHSMEEADALARRVAILARRVLALGTPDALRRRCGDALHVHLVAAAVSGHPHPDMCRVAAWVRRLLPSADVDSNTYHGQMRFSVRAADVAPGAAYGSAVGRLVVLLEEHKARLGIGHYSVSPITLDHVFLTIVGQHNVDEEHHHPDDAQDSKQSAWARLRRIARS